MENADRTPTDDDRNQSTFDATNEADGGSVDFEQVVEELTVDERVADAERRVLMAQAEMENFRKRMQRETEQVIKYANLPLIRDLLEVIDNLNRATEAAKADSSNPSALLSGVEMVGGQISTIFSKFGCKPIDAVGKEFDPNIHEAIAQMPSEQPAGHVSQVVAVGYMLHDRVVRPSSVIVSSGPAT